MKPPNSTPPAAEQMHTTTSQQQPPPPTPLLPSGEQMHTTSSQQQQQQTPQPAEQMHTTTSSQQLPPPPAKQMHTAPLQQQTPPTAKQLHVATPLQQQPHPPPATSTAEPATQSAPMVIASSPNVLPNLIKVQLLSIPTNITQVQQAPLALTTHPIRPQTHTSPSNITTSVTDSGTVFTAIATSTPAPASTTTTTTSTLPTTPVVVKSEPVKYICCLIENSVRCDRFSGNASFNARIQKIVATKKLPYTLDPSVRHTYICDYHKSIITVAKKQTPVARDGTKTNARNYTTQNNASQQNNQLNDLSIRQTPLQHPINMEMIKNSSRATANNHSVNNISMPRSGGQNHYSVMNQNQVVPMDVMMPTSFDMSAGGDSIGLQRASMPGGVDVDLQQLQVNTLRRYKRHFRVQTRPGLNKMQLAESLKSHFRTMPIIEKEAITYFVYIVKCYRNKLDHNPKAD